MTHPEKTQWGSCGKITEGPKESALPTLDIGNKGLGTFSVLDVVHTPGEDLVRKWPEFPITDEAVQGFNFLKFQLPHYPFLQRHFPDTIIKDNKKGKYFLQEVVATQPGRENMSSSSDPAVFDPEQIESPAVLNDLILLMKEGAQFFSDSVGNPDSGLEDGEGWYPEVHRPDSLVFGKTSGDTQDQVYFVDCHPLFPLTVAEVDRRIFKFNVTMTEVARDKFGMELEDLLRVNGFDTPLPSLEDRSIMETAAEELAQTPKSPGQSARAAGRVALAA